MKLQRTPFLVSYLQRYLINSARAVRTIIPIMRALSASPAINATANANPFRTVAAPKPFMIEQV